MKEAKSKWGWILGLTLLIPITASAAEIKEETKSILEKNTGFTTIERLLRKGTREDAGKAAEALSEFLENNHVYDLVVENYGIKGGFLKSASRELIVRLLIYITGAYKSCYKHEVRFSSNGFIHGQHVIGMYHHLTGGLDFENLCTYASDEDKRDLDIFGWEKVIAHSYNELTRQLLVDAKTAEEIKSRLHKYKEIPLGTPLQNLNVDGMVYERYPKLYLEAKKTWNKRTLKLENIFTDIISEHFGGKMPDNMKDFFKLKYLEFFPRE